VNTTIHALGLHLDRFLRGLLILLVLGLVLSVTWQVASRYLLQAPSSWTEESARFLLIWIGLLGAAYAYRTRAHMRLQFLEEKLGPAGARRLRAVVAFAVLVFALAVLVVGGVRLVLLTLELEQVSAALGIPMGLVYLALPLSGLLTAFYAMAEMIFGEGD
jgi:TRAP-type C4-dicarboxylate transport system permease small subunit